VTAKAKAARKAGGEKEHAEAGQGQQHGTMQENKQQVGNQRPDRQQQEQQQHIRKTSTQAQEEAQEEGEEDPRELPNLPPRYQLPPETLPLYCTASPRASGALLNPG